MSVPIAAPNLVRRPRIRLTPIPTCPHGTRRLTRVIAIEFSETTIHMSWVGL